MTGTRPCATAGCWRSGDPSGLCWECRTAQTGYLARLRQPSKCLECSAADIRAAFLAEIAHPGLRLVAGGAR